MNNNKENQTISFDVNETLFFQSGQGVYEMDAIALDPDILVQSYGDYVQIRGLILLEGQYKLALSGTGDKPNVNGTVENVMNIGNNNAAFVHRFPVDITVSAHRVTNIDDITVMVDVFDYELPDRNTLKIKSSIVINGIDATAADVRSNQDLVEDLVENKAENEDEDVVEEAVEAVVEKAKEAPIAEIVNQPEMVESVVESSEELADIEAEPVITDVKDVEEEEEIAEVREVIDVEAKIEEPTKEVADTSEIAATEQEDVSDVQFLTEMFGNETEDKYTQVRLYITQLDDTVATIAKQFDVPALQLLKDNDLTSESLSAGQLIKIPVEHKQTK